MISCKVDFKITGSLTSDGAPPLYFNTHVDGPIELPLATLTSFDLHKFIPRSFIDSLVDDRALQETMWLECQQRLADEDHDALVDGEAANIAVQDSLLEQRVESEEAAVTRCRKRNFVRTALDDRDVYWEVNALQNCHSAPAASSGVMPIFDERIVPSAPAASSSGISYPRALPPPGGFDNRPVFALPYYDPHEQIHVSIAPGRPLHDAPKKKSDVSEVYSCYWMDF